MEQLKLLLEELKEARAIDIVGYNTYRNESGLQIFTKQMKEIFDRPLYISEIGKYAYRSKGVDEEQQFRAIKGAWRTIVRTSAEYQKNVLSIKNTGNSIGVTFFDWLDKWYMDGEPLEHNIGKKHISGTTMLIHEEWYGLNAMGDGSDSLMRQKRKAYEYLKSVWNNPELKF